MPKGVHMTSAKATAIRNARMQKQARQMNEARKDPVTVPESSHVFKPLLQGAATVRRPFYDAPGCVVRSIDGVLA